MERWQKLNVYFGCGGLLLFVFSMIFIKKMPLLLLSAMFGVGILFKTFKNIYKGVEPPSGKNIKGAYEMNKKKKKK